MAVVPPTRPSLDVTDRVRVARGDSRGSAARASATYRFTNTSDDVVDTHLLIVVRGLPARTRLLNASGTTRDGNPYVRVFLPNGVLAPGASITQRLVIAGVGQPGAQRLSFTLLSGQGTP